MGYRSDLVIAIETVPVEGFQEVQTRILLEKPDWIDTVKVLLDTAIPESNFHGTWDKNGIHIKVDSWKWYSSYPEIMAIESMFTWFKNTYDLNEAKDQFPFKLNGVFIRIGEEEVDIETDYINEGYELAQINRDIITSFNC